MCFSTEFDTASTASMAQVTVDNFQTIFIFSLKIEFVSAKSADPGETPQQNGVVQFAKVLI